VRAGDPALEVRSRLTCTGCEGWKRPIRAVFDWRAVVYEDTRNVRLLATTACLTTDSLLAVLRQELVLRVHDGVNVHSVARTQYHSYVHRPNLGDIETDR